VGERTATAEDNVAGRKPETLDGERIQWQQTPELGLADAQALKPGGVDRALGKASVRATLVIQKGEDRSAREQVGHGRECALGAAHDQKVVVNECNTLASLSLWTG
jgi:hypothetical protein